MPGELHSGHQEVDVFERQVKYFPEILVGKNAIIDVNAISKSGILSYNTFKTAFIAHAGGPPINAYVIPLKLRPVLFTGTMAFFFFFCVLCRRQLLQRQ